MKDSVSGSQFHTRELTPPPTAGPASHSPRSHHLEGVRRALIDSSQSGEPQDTRAALARSVVDVRAALDGDADAIDSVRFMELQLSIGEIQDTTAASKVFTRLLGHCAVLARHEQYGVMQFLARELVAGMVATTRPGTPQERAALCEGLLKAAAVAYAQAGANAPVIESLVTGLAQGICTQELRADPKPEDDSKASPSRWLDRALSVQDADAVLAHLVSASALRNKQLERAFGKGLMAQPPDTRPQSNWKKPANEKAAKGARPKLAESGGLHSQIARSTSAVAALKLFIGEGPAIRKRSPQEFKDHREHLVQHVKGMPDSEVAAAIGLLREGLTPGQRKRLGKELAEELIEELESVFRTTAILPSAVSRPSPEPESILVDRKHVPAGKPPRQETPADPLAALEAEIDELSRELENRERELVGEFSALIETPGATNSREFQAQLSRFSSQRDIDLVVVERCRQKLREAGDIAILREKTLTWALDRLARRIAPG